MRESFDLWLDGVKELLKAVLAPLKDYSAALSNPLVGFTIVGSIFAVILVLCILRYGRSFRALMKGPQVLVISALMIALNIALGVYAIPISAYLRVGFGFITQPVVAMLFGPLVSCMTGLVQDVLSYLLNPTGGYLPVYTLCVGISGMIYGLMLYQKPLTFRRVFLTKALIVVFSNIILNSIALAPTVGSGFIGILPARIIKNLLLLPIQTVVVYILLKYLRKSKAVQRFV